MVGSVGKNLFVFFWYAEVHFTLNETWYTFVKYNLMGVELTVLKNKAL